MGSPTKIKLKSSTAAVAPVVPPPPEQPSESKGPVKLPVAAPAPAAQSNLTIHQRHGDRDSGEDDPADDVLLRAAQVRKRYGDCSDMWLHRRLHDDSGFPKPIFIGPARYWRLSDLLAWERARAELPVPQPRILKHRDRALESLAAKRAARRKQAEDAAQSSA